MSSHEFVCSFVCSFLTLVVRSINLIFTIFGSIEMRSVIYYHMVVCVYVVCVCVCVCVSVCVTAEVNGRQDAAPVDGASRTVDRET